MTTTSTTVTDTIKEAARRVSVGDKVCRAGYAAHGVVYLLVGLLAIDCAVGGGGAEGEREAISRLAQGSFGTALLTLLGAGLIGYSAMRLWQGLGNPAGHGADLKGLGARIGHLASGLASGMLALYALSLAYAWFGRFGGVPGSEGTADLTARVMSWPGGRVIVGAIGAGVCIAAIGQMRRAVRASFMRDLSLPAGATGWVRGLGRVGYAARSVVFLIAGGFVILAAVHAQPGEAGGLGGALRAVQGQPYGPWLLGLTGAGLVAFAVLRGVYARFAVTPARG